MQRLFASVLAVACIAGSTSSFARDGGPGLDRGGVVQDPTTLLAPAPPQVPAENPIPAPLPAPAQAPVINGPISQPEFQGLTGIGE